MTLFQVLHMQNRLPERKLPPCHGIIPARYGSTRFPGKALADILGKPMFWHVWSRACRCPELSSVTLATDDTRIADAAEKLHVPCVMTSPEHQSGTDRVFEAASLLKLPANSVIVNIQGDEPALMPHMLSALVRPFAEGRVRVATLAREAEADEAAQPDKVKLVCSQSGRALYFSRSAIPFVRDQALEPAQDGRRGPPQSGEALPPPGRQTESGLTLLHIGLYAFSFEALRLFTAFAPSPLELAEKLEQLRLLEHDIPIQVVLTTGRSFGVDKPGDLTEVIRVLNEEKFNPL
jgi:3-deoxy-manno-octulosonate cytidylyltransferase (CMP-KDO synthetase)